MLEKLLHLNKQADFNSSPELPQNSAVSFSMHSILQTHFDTILQLVLLKAVLYQNAIKQSLGASHN